MKAICILFITLLFYIGNLFAQEKTSIAVLALEAGGISGYESQVLTNRLRTELFRTNKFTVLERDKMDEILIEQGFQMTGCISNECVVEVGKLTGVQQMVAGNVAKIDNIFTVDIRLIDIESGKVIKTATEDCECQLKDVLTKSIINVANTLAGLKITESESNIKTYGQSTHQPLIEKLPVDSSHPQYKSPTISFFLSFLFPGLAIGQFYNGETAKGFIYNGVGLLGIVSIVTLGEKETSEWVADSNYPGGGYYNNVTEPTAFETIGSLLLLGSWILSSIDAPVSSNRINYEVGQKYGHLIEINHGNIIYGLDFGIHQNTLTGNVIVHF